MPKGVREKVERSSLVRRERPKRKKPTRYPWEEWFSQPKFTIKQGRDFTTTLKLMAAQVRNRAWHEQLSVGVSIDLVRKLINVEVRGAKAG